MPARFLASLVLELEGVDALALLDGVLAVRVAGIDGGVDGVEGGRGGEAVCAAKVLRQFTSSLGGEAGAGLRRVMMADVRTVLERHGGVGEALDWIADRAETKIWE